VLTALPTSWPSLRRADADDGLVPQALADAAQANADQAQQQAVKWGEGGLDRTLLHTLAGGLDGGLGGALGALASSEATPRINSLLLNSDKPSGLAFLLGGITAAGIGYAAGGVAGAGAATNQIYNNDFVDVKTGKIIPARCKAGDTLNGLPCAEGIVSALEFVPLKSKDGIQTIQTTSQDISVLSVPPIDIANTWQVDANGESTAPVISNGNLVSLPTTDNYAVKPIKGPYTDTYNPNATQETPVTVIDGTAQGVPYSLLPTASGLANNYPTASDSSGFNALVYSPEGQEAWGSALDKLSSLLETSTLIALTPLAVSGKSLSDAILNCFDQSTGACATNVGIAAAATGLGIIGAAGQTDMLAASTSADAAEASSASNAAADGAAGTGVQNAVSSGTTASGIAQLEVQSAASVNEAMLAEGNQPAWLANTNVVKQVVPAGTQYQMVVSAEQADALNNGGSWFGAWATPDAVTSQAYARDNLSILPEFKSDVSFVVTVETTAPQTVNKGFAGPLDGTTGGGAQVEFVGTKNLKVVGQAQPLSKE
jgi:hypothetical protein